VRLTYAAGTALVTGGSGGIGAAVVSALAEAGRARIRERDREKHRDRQCCVLRAACCVTKLLQF